MPHSGHSFGMQRLGVLAVALALGGCSSGSRSDDGQTSGSLLGELNDREFIAESIKSRSVVPGTEIRVRFRDQGITVLAGCNHLGGTFHLSGTRLKLTEYSSTEMGCDPALHAQDEWIGEFLIAGPSLELEEPRLVMATPDDRMTLIDREVASPDLPLVDVKWIGDGYGDDSAVSFGPGADTVTAQFDSNGNAAFYTGCQTATGQYTVDGAKLTLEGLIYDGTECSDNGLQFLEDQVTRVLDGDSLTFEIDENRLQIHQGKYTLYFRAEK